MDQLLNATGRFDRSPFHYARMAYLKAKADENMGRYIETRRATPGRVDSSHLLSKILLNINSKFDGDLVRYMVSVDQEAKRMVSSLGMTSSTSKGGIFKESVFYSCPEIILYSRSEKYSAMDLWRDWRSVTPIEVISHPVTDMTIFELGAKNSASLSAMDLCVINIDIPLLAAQWKMWQAANPGQLVEQFLSTVPLVGMMRSHLNVCMFNKLQVKLGIRKAVHVKTNTTFMQTPLDRHADEVIEEVFDKVSKKKMSGTEIMDSIPVIYGDTYLKDVALPSMTPTNQVLWALYAQKMEPVAVMLEFGKLAGDDQMVHEITQVRRSIIEAKSDNILTNGLSSSEATYLTERFDNLVVSRLPEPTA